MVDKKLTLEAERHASFSRRHFFRNVGACIALPAFASLYPRGAFAKMSLRRNVRPIFRSYFFRHGLLRIFARVICAPSRIHKNSVGRRSQKIGWRAPRRGSIWEPIEIHTGAFELS